MTSYRLRKDPDGYWTYIDGMGMLISTHSIEQCQDRDYGCAIHNNPSDHPLADAPMIWRDDTNILERVCEHGIGHPDYDSALYNEEQGKAHLNIHGCDGCCVISIDAGFDDPSDDSPLT